MSQKVYFTNSPARVIDRYITDSGNPRTFILTDENTAKCVLPVLLSESRQLHEAEVITTKAGDVNKNLDSLSYIWERLQNGGATRQSLLINLGGGMITDMGGFAGATFKRGLRFVNIPTTLLSAVDAAVGGKTGINFNGLKNEVGAFREADAVIISTLFFKTLPLEELKSGYAEMLKHGLIDNKEAYRRMINYNVESADWDNLLDMLEESVNVKRRIVTEDPLEHGIRRALNLGHTIGHAFESHAMRHNSPIPHGYAVAWGCVTELILSRLSLGFPGEELYRFASYVYDTYGPYTFTCDDYPELIELMHHDKKNTSSEINFTLLKDVGEFEIDRTCSEDDIKSALDIFRDLMHI